MEQNQKASRLGRALDTSLAAKFGEIAAVFGAAALIMVALLPLAGRNPLAGQGVIWLANVAMLVMVWLGLRVRGQGWEHLGLSLRFAGARPVLGAVLRSIVVSVVAVVAFLVPTIILGAILGRPEQADMSGYDSLRGNLPLFLLSLAGVYVVSSFGEEVIYRGFLMHRLAEMGSGRKAAWRLAVVVSAVVFGLVHFAWGPVGIVQTTFMGLALAISYLVLGRRLWPLILAHAYMDTLLIVQMYLGPS